MYLYVRACPRDKREFRDVSRGAGFAVSSFLEIESCVINSKITRGFTVVKGL